MTNKEYIEDAVAILNKIKDTAGLLYHEVIGMEYAIKTLVTETETCKFNCRTNKAAYNEGYEDGIHGTWDNAYEEYCNEQRLD